MSVRGVTGMKGAFKGAALRTRAVSSCVARNARRGRLGPVQVSAYKITLETPDGEQVIECDDSTYILDAAEEAGVELPWSCRAGACSSCTARTDNPGVVDQDDQTFLVSSKPVGSRSFFFFWGGHTGKAPLSFFLSL